MVHIVETDFDTNLQSKTIEQVLAIRKKECAELVDVVRRGLEHELLDSTPGSINAEVSGYS